MSRYYLFCYRITKAATRHLFATVLANILVSAALVLIIVAARNIGIEQTGNILPLCVLSAVVISVGGFLQMSLIIGIAFALVRGSDWGEEIESPPSYDSDSDWM